MTKLMDKKQAMAAMALGLRLRNLAWDMPGHRGALCCFLKEGAIWVQHQPDEYNIEDPEGAEWMEPEDFLTNGRIETGWYIYEQ